MIEIDGITVRGCISFDRSKKDTSSSGKVTWHKRWEAEAGYYGVAFRKRSKHRAILEDFLLDLHQLDKDGLLKGICEKCKEVDGGKKTMEHQLPSCRCSGPCRTFHVEQKRKFCN